MKIANFPFLQTFVPHYYLERKKKKHAAAQQSKTAHATARHAAAQLKVQQRQRADLPSTGCEGRKTQRKERKNDINTNAEPDAPTEYNRKTNKRKKGKRRRKIYSGSEAGQKKKHSGNSTGYQGRIIFMQYSFINTP